MNDRQRLEAIISVVCKYLPPDGIPINDAMSEIISLVDPLPPHPAQEPVAWVERIGGGVSYDLYHEAARKLPEGVKFDLYTAPPQRKPWVSLSDGQRKEIIKRECRYTSEAAQLDHQHLCYAIDAKLKERNHGT